MPGGALTWHLAFILFELVQGSGRNTFVWDIQTTSATIGFISYIRNKIDQPM